MYRWRSVLIFNFECIFKSLCVAVYQLRFLILHHQKALPWISLKTTESAGWPTTVEGLLASAPESHLQVGHFKQPSKGSSPVKVPCCFVLNTVMWPSSFATPQFQTGESHPKICKPHEIIHILHLNSSLTLGQESLQNQPGLANKKWTGLRKSHSCRDHMSIHYPPYHTGDATWPVLQCWILCLLIRILRSIRHPYDIF